MSANPTVAPTDLRDYLKSCGWSVLDLALKDRLYVMESSRYPRRQLVFPMDLTAPDYRDALELVFEKFADLTGLRQEVMRGKIQALRDDVLRLRVTSEDNDTALPLSFAATLVQNTEKLLKVAACTVLRPRMHHPRLTLAEASQLVEKARFQQTEVGSFVLKVACPVQALEVQGSLDLDHGRSPFVRQVTLALHQSLANLTTAIEADTLTQLVDELKATDTPMISANLCEAIAGMHDEQMDNSLEVSFDWSALYALPPQVGARPLRIQRDYFSRIEEVRRELRSVELDEEETFIGTVERLDGEMDEHGHRSGDVILALLLPEEGETVRVKITLSYDDYRTAHQAHINPGAYVQVTGRLRPGRQPRQLTHVTRFERVSL